MNLKLSKLTFGNICTIHIKNMPPTEENIKKTLSLFNLDKILLLVTALERDCEYIRATSKLSDAFEVVLPAQDTITSETAIVTSIDKALYLWQELVRCEPRIINCYGLKGDCNNIRPLFQSCICGKNDNILLDNCSVEVILSIILGENISMLSFNKALYNPLLCFRRLKTEITQNKKRLF